MARHLSYRRDDVLLRNVLLRDALSRGRIAALLHHAL